VAGGANATFVTLKAEGTGIVIDPHTANTSKDQMGADFFGNGRRIFVECSGDFFKRSSVIKHGFDDETVILS